MSHDDPISRWTDHQQLGGKDIFAKAYSWEMADQIRATGLYPYFQALDENQGPVARYQGREVLMLGSNNYLGLTTHPRVRKASMDAIAHLGTGLTGSRFLNGSIKLHEELEEKLAKFLGKESALVFTTGYQANLGMLTALINKNSIAIVDKLAHASIHDGCRLMEGETIRFPHNDLTALEDILKKIPDDKGALLFIDGVYSMEGDLCPLPEMVALAKKYNVRIAVDDAHGLGVIGPGGRGTAHHFNLQDQVDLIVGTFSKSLASIGGFVAGDRKVIDFIKHFGRPMLFSASLPPASAAAALEALNILIEQPELAQKTCANAQWMKAELTKIGYQTGHAEAAIVPVIIGDTIKTFMMWKQLLDEGVYTNPVPYPAVARGNEMLRTSYLATQSPEQLERARDIFASVAKSFDIGK
jgi:8-amino-7-oxononanoate synthase